jgi:Gpi18-like mannosyltransferase
MATLDTTAAESPRAATAPAQSWWRPRRVDLMALGVWAASRIVILVVSLVALASRSGTSWTGLWDRWDWERYLTIAEYGYTSGKGPAYDTNLVAFFPGFPLVVRAVHVVVRNWTVSGLLVSLVAGAAAVVALARLTEFEWSEWHTRRPDADEDSRAGSRAAVTAVLLLVCAPAAIFLAAGYTESLFLAFAVPAWLAARRRHWVAAGVLTALACTVRVNGVFVAAGIIVMFALSRPAARDWKRAPALALPVVSVVAYMG